MCMYVGMYVGMYVCMYILVTHAVPYIYIYIYVCVYVCTYILVTQAVSVPRCRDSSAPDAGGAAARGGRHAGFAPHSLGSG